MTSSFSITADFSVKESVKNIEMVGEFILEKDRSKIQVGEGAERGISSVTLADNIQGKI